jgi:hypothetical protein
MGFFIGNHKNWCHCWNEGWGLVLGLKMLIFHHPSCISSEHDMAIHFMDLHLHTNHGIHVWRKQSILPIMITTLHDPKKNSLPIYKLAHYSLLSSTKFDGAMEYTNF